VHYTDRYLQQESLHDQLMDMIAKRQDGNAVPACAPAPMRLFHVARDNFTWPRFSAAGRDNVMFPAKVLGEGTFGTVSSSLLSCTFSEGGGRS